MYIIKTLVLESIPDPFLTYHSKEPLKRGNLISVPLKGRIVSAFVIESKPIREEKLFLKKAGYMPQAIKDVISESPVISPRQKLFFERISLRYNLPLSTVLKRALPTPAKTFLHFPHITIPTSTFALKERKISFHEMRDDDSNFVRGLFQDKSFLSAQNLIIVPSEALLDHYAYIYRDYEIVVYKKTMSQKKLRELWIRILRGDPITVIGLPSAFYLPWNKVHSLVVFNASSDFYKSRVSPFIDSQQAVLEFSSIHTSDTTYCDITPKPEWAIKIQERDMVQPATVPAIIHYEKRSRKEKDVPAILPVLREALREKSKEVKKVIVFVNRRGYAPFILCGSCGVAYCCSRCSAGLVRHEDGSSKARVLTCHRCGYVEKNPQDVCPECHGFFTTFYGAGTEKVEQELRTIFPEHGVFRFDSDSAKTLRQEEGVLKNFWDSPRAVLVTTELIFKHPLFPVDVSVVLDIDRMYTIPDFNTEERVFRMLRTLGSYSKNFYIQAQDKERSAFKLLNTPLVFLEKEMKARERYEYPPYNQLTKITYAHKDKSILERVMLTQAKELRECIVRYAKEGLFEVSEPFPAFVAKVNQRYISHILLRLKKLVRDSTDEDIRIRNLILKHISRGWIIDIDSSSIL